ncbi:DUF4180 domain-containing protein [Sphingobacterium suaedae]|uniref:DUF4180 domain-containing protein n=1 Tax=Sphingobacterium suaedae TaxID=1686402 RepID=A0ABW5KJ28_9SPHI
MEITEHTIGQLRVAQIHTTETLFQTVDDATDFIGYIYYQGFDALILDATHIATHFFDLRTKIAGEILQKFTNYRMRITLVGDWRNISSDSLSDFIRECNSGKQVHFAQNLDEALTKLAT